MVWSLGWADPLEMEMATYFNMPSWEIPWTVKPGGQESQTRLSNYTTTKVICKSRTESRDCTSQNIQPSKWIMPLEKLKIQLKERKSDYIPFRSWGPLLVPQAWTPCRFQSQSRIVLMLKRWGGDASMWSFFDPSAWPLLVGNTSCGSCWAFLHPYQAKCIQRTVLTLGRKSFRLSPGLQPRSPFPQSFQAHLQHPEDRVLAGIGVSLGS